MKKIFYYAIYFLLSGLTLYLCSCAKTTSLDTSATTTLSQQDTISSTVSSNFGTYLYSADLSLQDVNNSVSDLELILDYLNTVNLLAEENIVYYLNEDDLNLISYFENTIYLDVSDVHTYLSIQLTLQYLVSEYSNYGVIFGVSNVLAEKLGFSHYAPVHDSEELSSFFSDESNTPYLDITYPCFIESYSTENQIQYVMDFSCVIAKYIVSLYGFSSVVRLIDSTYSQSEFYEQLCFYTNEWLGQQNTSFSLTPKEIGVSFSSNVGTYLLIWHTSHATWRLSSDYLDLQTIQIFPNMFLKRSYVELIDTINILENDMCRLDELIMDTSIEYPDLQIFITGPSDSNYFVAERIYIYTILALSHEYVHYLSGRYIDTTVWMREAYACYFSFGSYFMGFQIQYFITSEMDYAIPFQQALEKFESMSGREFNYQEDYVELVNYYIGIIGDYNDVFLPYGEYSAFQQTSFIAYFIDMYGISALKEVAMDNGLITEITSKSWNEIRSDWQEYIIDNYV